MKIAQVCLWLATIKGDSKPKMFWMHMHVHQRYCLWIQCSFLCLNPAQHFNLAACPASQPQTTIKQKLHISKWSFIPEQLSRCLIGILIHAIAVSLDGWSRQRRNAHSTHIGTVLWTMFELNGLLCAKKKLEIFLVPQSKSGSKRKVYLFLRMGW